MHASSTQINSNTFDFLSPDDGVYYLHVYNSSKTSSESTIKFMIDSTSPAKPNIVASTLTPNVGDTVRYKFTSSDKMSSLQKNFYVSIDGGILLPIGDSLFSSFDKRGPHTILVRSYDLAGNYSDSSLTVNVR